MGRRHPPHRAREEPPARLKRPAVVMEPPAFLRAPSTCVRAVRRLAFGTPCVIASPPCPARRRLTAGVGPVCPPPRWPGRANCGGGRDGRMPPKRGRAVVSEATAPLPTGGQARRRASMRFSSRSFSPPCYATPRPGGLHGGRGGCDHLATVRANSPGRPTAFFRPGLLDRLGGSVASATHKGCSVRANGKLDPNGPNRREIGPSRCPAQSAVPPHRSPHRDPGSRAPGVRACH